MGPEYGAAARSTSVTADTLPPRRTTGGTTLRRPSGSSGAGWRSSHSGCLAGSSLRSVQDVADELQVGPQTVRRLIVAGELSAIRIGRQRRNEPAGVERLERLRCAPATAWKGRLPHRLHIPRRPR
ncbi:helix-turn-helix domain-containing protein [Pseudonocardia sp.]|uniref:helix-turn-helix domain-containing protein n=1 Tax=Pseudonocardia sp. TaxID=60912 RepID=UPI0034554D3E